MGEMSFYLAVFGIIEHLTKSELTTTSKKLLITYLEQAEGDSHSDRAREAVRRYTQTVLPTLDSIRGKHQTMELDDLDDLVLKLEYEAARLSKRVPPSRGAKRPAAGSPTSPSTGPSGPSKTGSRPPGAQNRRP